MLPLASLNHWQRLRARAPARDDALRLHAYVQEMAPSNYRPQVHCTVDGALAAAAAEIKINNHLLNLIAEQEAPSRMDIICG